MKHSKVNRLIVLSPRPRLIYDVEAERLADRVGEAVLAFLAARAEEKRSGRIVH